MKLWCQDKVIELKNCTSFFSRFKGFMMCKKIDSALLFDRCNSIHTFFMVSNIDVILCDSNNIVLEYYNDVGPNRVIISKKGATRIYEVPVNYFDVKIGYKLEVE